MILLSLNMTCVFAPAAEIFPEILPITLPMKYGAVTFPLTPRLPVTVVPVEPMDTTLAILSMLNVMLALA